MRIELVLQQTTHTKHQEQTIPFTDRISLTSNNIHKRQDPSIPNIEVKSEKTIRTKRSEMNIVIC